MSLVFFGTDQRDRLVEFYIERIGMERWLEQPDTTILKHENMLVGLNERNDLDTWGTTTFVYETRDEVDAMYHQIEDIADGEPRENAEYEVYQFYAEDPEGRTLEFQAFLHPVDPV